MKRILCFAVTLVFLGNVSHAQNKTVNSTSNYKGFKAPKLTTVIGEYKDSVQLTVEEAKKLLSLPIKISDGKNSYKVSSYQFLYRKKNFIQDESGRTAITNGTVSQLFRETPLDAIWIKTIREDLKSGEQLYFFDIIVKDGQGRVMYAPDVKIMVK